MRPMTLRTLFLTAFMALAPFGLAQAGNLEADLKALCAKVGSGTQSETPHMISLKEAAEILKNEGYRVTDIDDDSFKIKVNGRTLVMFRFDDGDFQLYYGVSGIKVDYKTINEWNRTKRLSRAYIDRVNDPVIEADLLGDAGLTAKQLIHFTKTFADVTVPKYRDYLLENGK